MSTLSTPTLSSSAEILKKLWSDETMATMTQMQSAMSLFSFGRRESCNSVLLPLPSVIFGSWRSAPGAFKESEPVWFYMPVAGFLEVKDLIFAAPYDAEARAVLFDWLMERGWLFGKTAKFAVKAWCAAIANRLIFSHWTPAHLSGLDAWLPSTSPGTFFGLSRTPAARLAEAQLLVNTGVVTGGQALQLLENAS